MKLRKTLDRSDDWDRPTERQALNHLTLVELEELALATLRKRAYQRKYVAQNRTAKRA